MAPINPHTPITNPSTPPTSRSSTTLRVPTRVDIELTCLMCGRDLGMLESEAWPNYGMDWHSAVRPIAHHLPPSAADLLVAALVVVAVAADVGLRQRMPSSIRFSVHLSCLTLRPVSPIVSVCNERQPGSVPA